MIASPGDVQAERHTGREVLYVWNSVHGARRKLLLMPVGWETDLAPEMGDQPQNIINKRILKDADLLVGIFWTRLGTPTSSYASGAVEEIEQHLAAGKPAMLYFSTAPVAPDAVDPEQYRALKTFKQSCKSRGVYETYADVGEFRREFSKHLQILMNTDGFGPGGDEGTTTSRPATGSSASAATLSPEAAQLLKAASAESAGGMIFFERFGGGASIYANDQTFNQDSSARTLALWEGAIEELEAQGLLKAANEKREVFQLTRQGFVAADALSRR
jgi:hypothetical protein